MKLYYENVCRSCECLSEKEFNKCPVISTDVQPRLKEFVLEHPCASNVSCVAIASILLTWTHHVVFSGLQTVPILPELFEDRVASSFDMP